MTHVPIEILFKKFLNGDCTDEEINIIIDYLKYADDSESIPGVEEVRKLFPELEKMDVDAADRIFKKIVQQSEDVYQKGHQPSGWLRTISSSRMMAASIALLTVLSVSGYYLLRTEKITYATDYGQTDRVRLADGSVVTLNANTRIKVKKAFMEGTKREVWVEGEAFFEVTPLPEKTFVVHTTQGLDITVLGTAFNVNTRKDEARVVLSHGSIKAQYKREEQLLQPGEMLFVASGGPKMKKTTTDTLYYASWRHHLLAFKNERLNHVANTIKDRYGYEVVFTDSQLENMRFTGSVPADNLDMAINMIALAFDLEVNRSGKRIVLITK